MELDVVCNLVTRHSQKTNKDYQVLVITFDNGYEMTLFLTNEQQFILNQIAH